MAALSSVSGSNPFIAQQTSISSSNLHGNSPDRMPVTIKIPSGGSISFVCSRDLKVSDLFIKVMASVRDHQKSMNQPPLSIGDCKLVAINDYPYDIAFYRWATQLKENDFDITNLAIEPRIDPMTSEMEQVLPENFVNSYRLVTNHVKSILNQIIDNTFDLSQAFNLEYLKLTERHLSCCQNTFNEVTKSLHDNVNLKGPICDMGIVLSILSSYIREYRNVSENSKMKRINVPTPSIPAVTNNTPMSVSMMIPPSHTSGHAYVRDSVPTPSMPAVTNNTPMSVSMMIPPSHTSGHAYVRGNVPTPSMPAVTNNTPMSVSMMIPPSHTSGHAYVRGSVPTPSMPAVTNNTPMSVSMMIPPSHTSGHAYVRDSVPTPSMPAVTSNAPMSVSMMIPPSHTSGHAYVRGSVPTPSMPAVTNNTPISSLTTPFTHPSGNFCMGSNMTSNSTSVPVSGLSSNSVVSAKNVQEVLF